MFTRAARAWNMSRPHDALMILTEAGMIDEWPVFRDTLLRRARERYLSLMP